MHILPSNAGLVAAIILGLLSHLPARAPAVAEARPFGGSVGGGTTFDSSGGGCQGHFFAGATCNGTNYFGYTHWDMYNIADCGALKRELGCSSIATNPVYCEDGRAWFNSAWGMQTELNAMLVGNIERDGPKCSLKLVP